MKKILSFLFFFCSLFLFAQEVSVPYRFGDQFALSDMKGKKIIEETFYDLTPLQGIKSGYFMFINQNGRGLIYNKKVLLTGKDYDDFKMYSNAFIIAHAYDVEMKNAYKNDEEYHYYKKRRNYQSLFNFKGENLYPDNFKRIMPLDTCGISTTRQKRSKYSLFITENFNTKYSFIVLDNDKQVISEWLTKDFYNVNIKKDQSTLGYRIVFEAQKKEYDTRQKMSIDIVNGKFVLVETDDNKNSKNRYNEHYGSGTNKSSSDKSLTVDPIQVVDSPIDSSTTISKSKENISTEFTIKDGGVFLSKTTNHNSKNKSEKKLDIPFSEANIESLNYYTFTTDKERISCKNAVKIENQSKFGYVITEDKIIPAEYDFIQLFIKYDGRNSTLYFKIGQLDPQSKIMKYGTMDIDKNILIPVIYEDLNYNFFSESYDNNQTYSDKWFVKKDGKSGFISSKNEIILPIIYDEIKVSKLRYKYYNCSAFCVLKKDNLYGLYKTTYNNKDLFIEPKFKKKIGFYIENYQNVKDLTLYGLINEDDSIYSFAKADGTVFTKQ